MASRARKMAALLVAAAVTGCGARTNLLLDELDGAAASTGASGEGGGVTCATTRAKLSGRIRDMSNAHPDFNKFLGDDRGIVKRELGADGTPVYAGDPMTPTTTGAADFHDWYHDVPGVNLGEPFTLPLTGDATSFSFEDAAFFPIDGQLLGDQGFGHNFSFTLELHGTFVYAGGETFELAGDDDLWLFVDGRLAVDLGGVHSTEDGSVSVDSLAPTLGLKAGAAYPIDVFFAERHTFGSTLQVTLSGPELCLGASD